MTESLKRAALVFSSKCLQERHEELNLGGGELTTQLIATHDEDGTFERAGRTVVEIRRGQSDVSQTGHLEHVLVGSVASQAESTRIAGEAQIWCELFHHAEALVHVP